MSYDVRVRTHSTPYVYTYTRAQTYVVASKCTYMYLRFVYFFAGDTPNEFQYRIGFDVLNLDPSNFARDNTSNNRSLLHRYIWQMYLEGYALLEDAPPLDFIGSHIR